MIVAQTNKDAGRFRDEAFVDTSASTVMQPIGGNTDLLCVEKPVSTVVKKSISTLVAKPVSAFMEKPISTLVKSKVVRLLGVVLALRGAARRAATPPNVVWLFASSLNILLAPPLFYI